METFVIFKILIILKIAHIPPYGGSWSSEIDLNYRILADHARMICICIADGVLPDKKSVSTNKSLFTFRYNCNIYYLMYIFLVKNYGES